MNAELGAGAILRRFICRPPIDRQPSAGVRLPVTESQAERTLALPFFNRIKREQIAEVCGVLLEVIGKIR